MPAPHPQGSEASDARSEPRASEGPYPQGSEASDARSEPKASEGGGAGCAGAVPARQDAT
jgi:hypothetical protein